MLLFTMNKSKITCIDFTKFLSRGYHQNKREIPIQSAPKRKEYWTCVFKKLSLERVSKLIQDFPSLDRKTM